MRAILFDQAYQAESASERERKRHSELFRSNIVAFRLKAKKLDVEPHSGGLSLKTAFSGSENYEFWDKAGTVTSGEIMLVRQNEVYRSSISTPMETDSFSLFFPFEFCRELASGCRDRSVQRFLDSGASNSSFPGNPALLSTLHTLATALGAPASDLEVEELVARLREAMGIHLEDVVEGYSKIRMRSHVRKADRLRRVMRAREMLHAELGKDVTLPELAAEARMSEFHLLRSFAEVFGTTPARYLERLKINRARHLLLTSHLPVKVVASQVGYENFSAFCRSFRRATGTTPRMFRVDNQASGD
jgi:AraC-like DNA-binding protein